VHAQQFEHDDAYLVGTRESLTRLRDTIDAALGNKAQGKSSDSLAEFFTADGEGYDLYVKVVPSSVELGLQLPYAEPLDKVLQRGREPNLVPTE